MKNITLITNTKVRRIPLIWLFTLSLSSIAMLSAKEIKVHQIAKPSIRPKGSPEYGDVCFRYGWIRTNSFPTVKDAKKAMREFHATRVDWFYPGSHLANPGATYVSPEAKQFIDWCHQEGMKICGTINSNTTHLPWKYRKHHLTRYVGEVNNPDFVKEVLKWGKAQIDAGVDTLVCDDIFKYNEPRKQIWSDNVLSILRNYKPGFRLAGNNGSSIGTDYVKKFSVDYHYSDNNFVPDPRDWWLASKAHRALGSAFLIHPNKHISAELRRKLIALGYASGAHVITPWDEYIHGKKRLFANPSDFADLYGFARYLNQLGFLNGYEDAFVGGHDLKENRYGNYRPAEVKAKDGAVSVFGRAKPENSTVPVVLHLVEWKKAKGVQLKIRNRSFFEQGQLKLELHRPRVYEQEIHTEAEEKGDYTSLATAETIKSISKDGWTTVELPKLSPWAVLIVSSSNSD